jgi:hypothetical protein
VLLLALGLIYVVGVVGFAIWRYQTGGWKSAASSVFCMLTLSAAIMLVGWIAERSYRRSAGAKKRSPDN